MSESRRTDLTHGRDPPPTATISPTTARQRPARSRSRPARDAESPGSTVEPEWLTLAPGLWQVARDRDHTGGSSRSRGAESVFSSTVRMGTSFRRISLERDRTAPPSSALDGPSRPISTGTRSGRAYGQRSIRDRSVPRFRVLTPLPDTLHVAISKSDFEGTIRLPATVDPRRLGYPVVRGSVGFHPIDAASFDTPTRRPLSREPSRQFRGSRLDDVGHCRDRTVRGNREVRVTSPSRDRARQAHERGEGVSPGC